MGQVDSSRKRTTQPTYVVFKRMFKFLIEKGVAHIVEPRPSLHELPSNSNWAEKKRKWKKFIAEREWEYFLSKYTELSGLSKKRWVGYGGVAGHMSR